MLTTIIIAIVFGYLALALVMYIFQHRLVFFPSREMDFTPENVGLPYEDITLRTADGLTLQSWFVPADSARAVILFCHGNAGNIGNRVEAIRQFNSLGLSVFIFDYRGYGQSEGQPSETGLNLDAEAAWAYLTGHRGLPPEKIIVLGRSLGGAVAINLAAEHQPAALMVESSFTSLPDIAAHHYPFLPVKFLSRYRFNSKKTIKRVLCPVLFVHSPDDRVVPFSHGRRLYSLANQPKHFIEITGAHNDGFLTTAECYEAGINRFLDEYLPR